MKIKEKTFYPSPYAARVHVVIADFQGPQLFEHVLKKFGVSIPNLQREVDGCAGCCNMKDDLCVLWLRDVRDDIEAIDILTHEALHAVSFVLKFSGLRFSSASEEAYAYLTGWLNRNIWAWAKGK